MKKVGIGLCLTTMLSVGISGCETISETECLSGNWRDIGYSDGLSGKSSTILSDYAETCFEHGARVDQDLYLSGYDRGLDRYCVYDKGFSLGENGSRYNSVCDGPRAEAFRAGYDDGREKYEYYAQYDRLTDAVSNTEDQLDDVRKRLSDPALASDERDRLRKKRDRLEDELRDRRWELRQFNRS